MNSRRLPRLPLWTALLVLVWSAHAAERAHAQDRPNDEPSSLDTLMDRTDLGNVSQAAMMAYHAGVRDLERARKLKQKAADLDDEAKRAKQLKKAGTAYESAIRQLTEAVRTNPKLVEAYDVLGRAFLESGRPEEALQVYAAGLQLAPEDPDQREGLAEALLGSGRVRDAAAAYNSLREGNEEAAARLLVAMKQWVDQHRKEPGGMDPEVVEALATLIQQWEREG